MEFERHAYYETTESHYLHEAWGALLPNRILVAPGTICYAHSYVMKDVPNARGHLRQLRHLRLVFEDARPGRSGKLLHIDVRVTANNRGPVGFTRITSPLMILALADKIGDLS